MPQANRYIKGNPALDDVDHALGRPYDPFNTYRNYYATSCPDKIREFRNSKWWDVGSSKFGMTYCHVSDEGRKALAAELADESKYGRLYEITSKRYDGRSLIYAKNRSQAKYRAWYNADIDWPFIDYAKEINVRLAATQRN